MMGTDQSVACTTTLGSGTTIKMANRATQVAAQQQAGAGRLHRPLSLSVMRQMQAIDEDLS